ncbi:MAG TPA: cell surface protein SprA, partial [Bacteroidales bacterium]|nr:cell surface protein SprA [Bacteroidales bacterium]
TSNFRDDPSLNSRQRRVTNFDFQEKIQMNVVAKVGDKIEFKANYNTESSFSFDNKLQLKYEGKEDEIIKLIEVGNVNLPLNSTLIQGSQSLFGIKSKLQFGRTSVTAVVSQQESQTTSIQVQGGAQTSKFKIKADAYEENKHFFMAQYFRDNYEKALAQLPIVASDINITKVEVWVTNIGAAVTDNRNIVAFQDMGEPDPYNPDILPIGGWNTLPSNKANTLFSSLDLNQVRNINGVSNYLKSRGYTASVDFEKVESARKLNSTEYSVNARLGFISLNTTINSDQTLAIAYQYTRSGDTTVYQVGEFSDGGVTAPSALMVKLLKSTSLNPRIPIWKLMMKNVYAIGSYQINSSDFILNILYSGSNNGVPTGYINAGRIAGLPLLQVMNLDNLDAQLNRILIDTTLVTDGIFDFIDGAALNGGTINSSNGRVYFPVLEPFGSHLRKMLGNDLLADQYCYDSLYTLTKVGAQQYPDKNKFILEGSYKSSSSSEISLNAINVPQGSVKVTMGGVPLTENVDYTVDYTLGRVKIINEALLASGTPINISLESNSMFSIQSKTYLGLHVDHQINKDFVVGATVINLTERPLTQKTIIGDDPISNTLWGMNLSWQQESQWLTRMIDKLPGIETKAPSKVSVVAEFAHFIPGHSKAIGSEGTSYVDD